MSTSEATETPTRNQAMTEAVIVRGERGAAVAARYGVSRERVNQIVTRESGLTREEVGALARAARLRTAAAHERDVLDRVSAALLERPRDAESLARDLGVGSSDVTRALSTLRTSAPTVRARLLRDRRDSSATAWENADLEAELRRVATGEDGALRYATGSDWVDGRDADRFPSQTYVERRYGSWSAFAAAAGLPAAPARRRSYSRQWSDEEVLDAVRRAIADGVTSVADYNAWVRDRAEPSYSLVILRLAPLSWTDIRATVLTGTAASRAA